jgi:GNAT superfamily N-acetyltransferase
VNIEVRALRESERAPARGVAARAFFDEAFMVGMLGTDPLTRYAGAVQLYDGEAWDDSAVNLGAFAGSALVGVIRASPVGACTLCRTVDPTSPPSDEIARMEWAFEVGSREVHLRHGEHGWISRVAVEPQVHGTGVGGRLIRTALDSLAARGGGLVVLECLASRESFYVRHGFHRLDDVPEPYADEASCLMAVDLAASLDHG